VVVLVMIGELCTGYGVYVDNTADNYRQISSQTNDFSINADNDDMPDAGVVGRQVCSWVSLFLSSHHKAFRCNC
jgi:hypothetical protein